MLIAGGRAGAVAVDSPFVGFWGFLIVHQGEPLLADLFPEVEAFRQADLDYDRVNGAWQVSRVHAAPPDLPTDLLPRLRDLTGAPVIAADVCDSDGAFVRALGHRVDCRAWLQLDGALGYLLTPYTINGDDSAYLRENADLRTKILAETPGGVVAAAAAIEWAHQAGLTPVSVDELAAVFDGNSVFVEEQFIKLLNGLGLDTAAAALPAPMSYDVLTSCVGHRLEGVDRVPHHAARQRQPRTGAADLRLRFEGSPPITVCLCTTWNLLLPDTQAEGEPFGEPFTNLVGEPLTATATLSTSRQPNGIALRLGDTTVWLALIDGEWVTDEAVLRSHKYKVQGWLAGVGDPN